MSSNLNTLFSTESTLLVKLSTESLKNIFLSYIISWPQFLLPPFFLSRLPPFSIQKRASLSRLSTKHMHNTPILRLDKVTNPLPLFFSGGIVFHYQHHFSLTLPQKFHLITEFCFHILYWLIYFVNLFSSLRCLRILIIILLFVLEAHCHWDLLLWG